MKVFKGFDRHLYRMLQINHREKLPNNLNTRLKFSFITGLCIAAIAIFISPGSIGGGGFLAPSLGLGTAIGSMLATLAPYPNHEILVLVGMAAFLSAIVRAPFTAADLYYKGQVPFSEIPDRIGRNIGQL